jgi:hypothetical protein
MDRVCGKYGKQERRMYGFGCGHLIQRSHMDDLGVDGRIIIKWIFKKLDGKARTGLLWHRMGT